MPARVNGRLRLDGPWRVRDAAAGSPAGRAWIRAVVPGCVHLDLLRARKIPDPFFGTNENDVQWVGGRDWEYERRFSLPKGHAALSADRVDLVFEGLDTFAEVRLNGALVGRSDNMFIPWRFDAGRTLKAGRNMISIRFTSPEKVIAHEQQAQPKLAALLGRRAQAFIRKAQCHFGWDWGPRLVTSGIWRPCRLEWHTTARIASVYPRTESISRGTAHVAVDVETEAVGPVCPGRSCPAGSLGTSSSVRPDETSRETRRRGAVTCEATLAGEALTAQATARVTAGRTARLAFTVPQAALWWPNGTGEQPLYDLTVTLRDDSGAVLDRAKQRIGLRTVKLVREPDEAGESFIFEINGKPIFCKGSNWIPPDSFPPRFTEAKYRRLLTMAVEANHNILRVWGGGFYETSAFYALCDELGLMIWQDFMFACSRYPETRAFLANVRREAEATVRRLRPHASIILWNGNNECQWIYRNDPKLLGAKIYDQLLPAVIGRLDPSRPYWPGSPTGGEDPNSPDQGNRHNWEAFHGGKGVQSYLEDHGRFLSEFGFQSPPSMRAIRAVTTPAERYAQSRIMEHHQKCGPGAWKLVHFIFDDLKLPVDFEDYVYKGQVMHARAIRAGVEHWRRNKFHTAGTIIWQLNDCWPVTSWSLIDSLLVPKAPYYYARRFFAPVLVSLVRVEGGVEVWIVNDALEGVGGHLQVEAMTFGGRVLSRLAREVRVPANVSRRALRIPDRRLKLADPAECFLAAELTAGKLALSRNVLLFEKPRRIAFPEPTIQVKSARIDELNHWLLLTADVFVKDLHLDFGDLEAELTDDFIDLIPGREELVNVSCVRPITSAALRKALQMKWMR